MTSETSKPTKKPETAGVERGACSTVPTARSYSDFERTAERLISDPRERRLFLARARARRRDEAQKRGVDVDDVPWGIAFLRRPDSWLPYERDLVIARGRQLARKYGWKDIRP